MKEKIFLKSKIFDKSTDKFIKRPLKEEVLIIVYKINLFLEF